MTFVMEVFSKTTIWK